MVPNTRPTKEDELLRMQQHGQKTLMRNFSGHGYQQKVARFMNGHGNYKSGGTIGLQ